MPFQRSKSTLDSLKRFFNVCRRRPSLGAPDSNPMHDESIITWECIDKNPYFFKMNFPQSWPTLNFNSYLSAIVSFLNISQHQRSTLHIKTVCPVYGGIISIFVHPYFTPFCITVRNFIGICVCELHVSHLIPWQLVRQKLGQVSFSCYPRMNAYMQRETERQCPV